MNGISLGVPNTVGNMSMHSPTTPLLTTPTPSARSGMSLFLRWPHILSTGGCDWAAPGSDKWNTLASMCPTAALTPESLDSALWLCSGDAAGSADNWTAPNPSAAVSSACVAVLLAMGSDGGPAWLDGGYGCLLTPLVLCVSLVLGIYRTSLLLLRNAFCRYFRPCLDPKPPDDTAAPANTFASPRRFPIPLGIASVGRDCSGSFVK